MARATLTTIIQAVREHVGFHTAWTDPPETNMLTRASVRISNAYQWSYRKRLAFIQTIAPYAAGTVAATLGSATVTGTGTAWTAAMVNRAIRLSGEVQYLFIQAVNVGAQTLTLGDINGNTLVWGQATATGMTYSIFPIHYALPANLDLILGPTQNFKMHKGTVEEFDRLDPLRNSRGKPSRFAMSQNQQTAGVESMNVEWWPVPDAIYTFRMPYLIKAPETLKPLDIPLCPTELVEHLGTAWACRYLHAKSGDPRWDALAERWKADFLALYQDCVQEDIDRYGLPDTILDGEETGWLDSSRDWSPVG